MLKVSWEVMAEASRPFRQLQLSLEEMKVVQVRRVAVKIIRDGQILA